MTSFLSRVHLQLGQAHVYRPLCTRLVLCDAHRKQHYSAKAINYYDVLEVTPKASARHIKSSYYRLSKRYHPDVNKDESAKEKFAQISEAYEVLGNVAQKRLYDQGMLRDRAGQQGTDAPFHYDTFVNKEGFKKRGQAPTGRSNIYNFDEFYRQHYGEAMKGKQKYTRANVEREKQTKELQKKQKRLMLGYLLSLTGLLVTLFVKKKKL